MNELSTHTEPAPGLRERKKAKTRAAIQRHALRLFREQGYAATTVEQIAAAVEISPSTFFRYFATKEDVALYDDLDPIFIRAFEAQPAELSPIQAMRNTVHVVFGAMSAEETTRQWERARLILTVPELRMRMLDQFAGMITMIAELLARRLGRQADDPALRAYAGALIGVMLAAFLTGGSELTPDYLGRMDASLAYLEAGLPL